MAIGIALIVIGVLIVAIYVFIELKRFRHKLFAIFLIALILFFYLSFAYVLKGQNLDLKTMDGVGKATKIYWNWLGTIFSNTISITANAIKMDWRGNETST